MRKITLGAVLTLSTLALAACGQSSEDANLMNDSSAPEENDVTDVVRDTLGLDGPGPEIINVPAGPEVGARAQHLTKVNLSSDFDRRASGLPSFLGKYSETWADGSIHYEYRYTAQCDGVRMTSGEEISFVIINTDNANAIDTIRRRLECKDSYQPITAENIDSMYDD